MDESFHINQLKNKTRINIKIPELKYFTASRNSSTVLFVIKIRQIHKKCLTFIHRRVDEFSCFIFIINMMIFWKIKIRKRNDTIKQNSMPTIQYIQLNFTFNYRSMAVTLSFTMIWWSKYPYNINVCNTKSVKKCKTKMKSNKPNRE